MFLKTLGSIILSEVHLISSLTTVIVFSGGIHRHMTVTPFRERKIRLIKKEESKENKPDLTSISLLGILKPVPSSSLPKYDSKPFHKISNLILDSCVALSRCSFPFTNKHWPMGLLSGNNG